MNDFNLQAQAASVIAGRHGFRPEKVYDWANNHSHELTRMGHILSDPKVNSDFFEAIIEDKPFKLTNNEHKDLETGS